MQEFVPKRRTSATGPPATTGSCRQPRANPDDIRHRRAAPGARARAAPRWRAGTTGAGSNNGLGIPGGVQPGARRTKQDMDDGPSTRGSTSARTCRLRPGDRERNGGSASAINSAMVDGGLHSGSATSSPYSEPGTCCRCAPRELRPEPGNESAHGRSQKAPASSFGVEQIAWEGKPETRSGSPSRCACAWTFTSRPKPQRAVGGAVRTPQSRTTHQVPQHPAHRAAPFRDRLPMRDARHPTWSHQTQASSTFERTAGLNIQAGRTAASAGCSV